MAKAAKHTSGPWTAHWSKYSEGCYIVKAGAPSNRVLAKFDGDGDGPDAEEIASAHLIAAAPDMLTALKRCEAMVSTDQGPPNWDWVREVIAKAETITS